MASELLEMGLTMEEIESVTCFKDESFNASLSSFSPESHVGNLKAKPIKKEPKKKKKYVNNSDSDSSHGSSENFDFPRGVHGDVVYKPMPRGGRGAPFYHSTNDTHPGQIYDTYNQFNRMRREINPLIEKTNSATLRNEAIEQIWNPRLNGDTNTAQSSSSESNNHPKNDIREEKLKEPIREPSALTETRMEKTPPSTPPPPAVKEPQLSYLDALSRRTDRLNLNGTDSESSSDVEGRKRRDVKVKTQLYIPPHMRSRMDEATTQSSGTSLISSTSTSCADVSSSSFRSEVSSTSDKPAHHNYCDTEEASASARVSQETVKEPSRPAVKKTVAELCKKNVLISGLLRRNKAARPSSTLVAQRDSSSSTSNSCADVSSSSIPPKVSSSSEKTAHYDYCDTDIDSSKIKPPPSDFFPALPEDLVEFVDIEPPGPLFMSPLQSTPLAPPPEFEDSEEDTFYFYDPDSQTNVAYRIPRRQTDPGDGSSTRPIGTSTDRPDCSSGKKIASRKSPTGSSVQSVHTTGSAARLDTAGNVHASLFMNYTTARPGSAFSSVVPRHSPGIHPGPPISPRGASMDYATAASTRGFWPEPGEEDFNEAYPPLK